MSLKKVHENQPKDFKFTDEKNDKCIIMCSKKYFRPAEVENLKGNAAKAKKYLKWKPTKNINALIKDMINFELKELSYE